MRILFKLIARLIGIALVAASAFAGNWVGNELRVTDRAALIEQGGSEGNQSVGINVVVTNFVPAILAALLAGRPRTAWAFIAGVLSSALIGPKYEEAALHQIEEATGQEIPTSAQIAV